MLVPRSGYVSKNPSDITWPDVISDPVAESPVEVVGGGDSTEGGGNWGVETPTIPTSCNRSFK